jgi:hypothetical protein
VLGANVVVDQSLGLLGGMGQHFLRFRGKRDFYRRRDLVPNDNTTLDFFTDAFHGEMGFGEEPAGQALAFSNEAEQEVLRLDRIAAQLRCFVSGKEDYPLSSLGVPLEHVLHPIIASILYHSRNALNVWWFLHIEAWRTRMR